MTSEIFLGAFIFCSIDFVCISNLTFRRRKKRGIKNRKAVASTFSKLSRNQSYILRCYNHNWLQWAHTQYYVVFGELCSVNPTLCWGYLLWFWFYLSFFHQQSQRLRSTKRHSYKKRFCKITDIDIAHIFFARRGNGGVNPFLKRNEIKSPNNGCKTKVSETREAMLPRKFISFAELLAENLTICN